MQNNRKSNSMKNILNAVSGITLIALVVTIVVLLILASVSITVVFGDNGILDLAKQAAKSTTTEQTKEKIEVSIVSSMFSENSYGKVTLEDLQRELDNCFGVNQCKAFCIKDNIYRVRMLKTDEIYEINNGSVRVVELKEDTNPGTLTGNGTEELPYLIESVEDLIYLSEQVNTTNNYQNKYFELTNNLDFYNRDNFTPIGNSQDNYFTGNFNGNGFEIRNIKINVENYGGLFGCVKDAIIKNIGIHGTIETTGDEEIRTGGIIAELSSGNLLVDNCYNLAEIKGVAHTGGIIGCIVRGDCDEKIIIKNCFNVGNITSLKYTSGGILGTSGNLSGAMEIINCGNIGELNGNTTGGIVGSSVNYTKDMQINNCYNLGNSKSNSISGGILGIWDTDSMLTLNNCYNAGNIDNSGELTRWIILYS